MCEKGEAVVENKGFLILDLTTPLGIQLIIPPRKCKQTQMTRIDTELTLRVANCRIHVDRHMA